jgi:hypothetical protein
MELLSAQVATGDLDGALLDVAAALAPDVPMDGLLLDLV